MGPAVVAAGLVAGRVRDVLRDHNPGRQLLVAVNNAWFAVGPAIVLSAFGVNGPALADWPIYVLALASQLARDTVVGAAREWLVLGVRRDCSCASGLVFLVDVLLTPIGFLAAVVAQDGIAYLLVMPLAALFPVFARERRARIDKAIELSPAYRKTALVLGEVIVADDEYTGAHSYGVVALSLEIAAELRVDEEEPAAGRAGRAPARRGQALGAAQPIINKPGKLNDEEWAIIKRNHSDHRPADARPRRRRRCATSAWSCAPPTSATTATAIRTGSAPRRSRSRPGSSAWPTRSVP